MRYVLPEINGTNDSRQRSFDWQGEHFQYRNVNVWPRCYQAPHPPVWITGRSPGNVSNNALEQVHR